MYNQHARPHREQSEKRKHEAMDKIKKHVQKQMVTIHHFVHPKNKTGSQGTPRSFQEKCIQCHKNLANINKFVHTYECLVTIRIIKKK